MKMKKWLIPGVAGLGVLLALVSGCRYRDTNNLNASKTSVSWVNYYEGNELYLAALNRDKMAISSVQHLPILKFETVDALEQFKTDFAGQLELDRGYDEVSSFADNTKGMDRVYFEKYTVFAVYVPANSGSLRFGVNEIYNDGENFCIHIRQVNQPDVHTDDMAGWLITVPVEKSAVANCRYFDADLNNGDR